MSRSGDKPNFVFQADQLGRPVQAFAKGTKAYVNLHRKIKDAVFNISSNSVEVDVLPDVRSTGIKAYRDGIEEYTRTVTKQQTDVKGRLEDLRKYLIGVEDMQTSKTVVERLKTSWETFNSATNTSMNPVVTHSNNPANLVNKLYTDFTSVPPFSRVTSIGASIDKLGAELRSKYDEVVSHIQQLKDSVHQKAATAAVIRQGGGKNKNRDEKDKEQKPKGPAKWSTDALREVSEAFAQWKISYRTDIETFLNGALTKVDNELPPEGDVRNETAKIRNPTAATPEQLFGVYMKWVSSAHKDSLLQKLKMSDLPRTEALKVTALFGGGGNSQPFDGFKTFVETYDEVVRKFSKVAEDEKRQKRNERERVMPDMSSVDKAVQELRRKMSDAGSSLEKTDEAIKGVASLHSALEALYWDHDTLMRRNNKQAVTADSALSSSRPTGYSSSSYTGDGTGGIRLSDDKDYTKREEQRERYAKERGHMGLKAPDFMYRRPSLGAMKAAIKELDDFRKKIRDEVDPANTLREIVFGRAKETLERADDRLEEIKEKEKDTDPSREHYDRKKIGEYKADAMKKLLDGVEARFKQYFRLHFDFVAKQHRDSLKYMLYWREVGSENEDVKTAIKEYFENTRKGVVSESSAHITEMKNAFTRIVRSDDSVDDEALRNWHVAVNDDGRKMVRDRTADIEVRIREIEKRIADLYEGKMLRLRDVVLDSRFLIMYGIKLVRILFIWAALFFAERYFQLTYARAVYGENKDPPHPIVMIGIFLLLDLVMNLCLAAILLLVRALFSSNPRFPIDGGLLKAYFVDYLLFTVILFAIAAVIGDVIRNKKYFRYRYEGERGIRALSSMTFYISIVFVLVPFFRLL